MTPEIIQLINNYGFPGIVCLAMWYVLRHMETRNNEKDKLIYEILKEGQTRIESLVGMVLDLSREDAKNRAELKAAVETLIESTARMQEFCGRTKSHA